MSATRIAIMEPGQTALAHGKEVSAGERFEFAKNWRRFLAPVDEDRIGRAANSLKHWLEKVLSITHHL